MNSPSSAEEALRVRIAERTRVGAIMPVVADEGRSGIDDEYRRQLAEIKRLLERWRADPQFRELMRMDLAAAARSLHLSIEASGLEPLWDEDAAQRTPVEQLPLAALRFMAYGHELASHLDRLRSGSPTADPRYDAWRRRQARRVETELPPAAAHRMPHIPFAIELSQGCSVGCWFCGVSAPRLEEIFHYTADNAALFGAVIDGLVEICGDLAGHGLCYWATDPLDNPDYERFIVDCRRRTGRLPPTSTALALRDLGRTRALLELFREHGGLFDRFSVLSLGQLDRIHAAFSPDELLHVELTPQNKESSLPKASVGRARLRKPRPEESPGQFGERTIEDTSACVSGFLVRMVPRTVQLISPCLPTKQRPLGYIVFDEERFSDAAELHAVLRRMVETHMASELRGDERVAFHEHLAFEALPDGFRLVGQSIRRFAGGPLLATIGRVVHEGARTVEQILEESAETADTDAAVALHFLELMRDAGVLDIRLP